jgi:hypothetical protein
MLIMPVHLRVLLYKARLKVLEIFNSQNWENLRGNRTIQQLVVFMHEGLKGKPNCPTRDTIQFLYSYNNVRRDGNDAAHSASIGDMRVAVTTKTPDSRDRRCLEQLFKFAFDQDV